MLVTKYIYIAQAATVSHLYFLYVWFALGRRATKIFCYKSQDIYVIFREQDSCRLSYVRDIYEAFCTSCNCLDLRNEEPRNRTRETCADEKL